MVKRVAKDVYLIQKVLQKNVSMTFLVGMAIVVWQSIT